ncbi:MAG: hypothetical protein Q8T08_22750, partial [Ignavibacteria bacterium]|nr:hypothetical protein [Ignavibacteria bacterium]
MKKIFKFYLLTFTVLCIALMSCQDDYDPIGNNKPVPVLKLDSRFSAISGTGASIPINITSNAENFEVISVDSWLTGTYSNNLVTLTAAANPDDVVREANVKVSTVTGWNEAQVSTRVIQSNKGMNNIFANMLRTQLDADWKVLKANGTWTLEDNSQRTNSPGDVQSVMAYCKESAKTIRSATRAFKFSVDVKNSNNWAGIVFHATDDKNFFYIGLNINPTSLFVVVDRIYNGGGSPMAMDPGIVLSADRDAFLRCEIVTTTAKPAEFTLNVYELKTTGDVNLNTDLSVI